MAFVIRNLSVLNYTNGFTMWHYRSGKDTFDQVTEDNYFEDVNDMLSAGDLIMINAADGHGQVVVTEIGIDFNRNSKVVVATLRLNLN